VLHTAAYWLMLALRDAVPRRMPLAWSEFATIRRRLLKVGARVVEKAARICIHFASACPDAALSRRRPVPAAGGPVRNLGTLTAGAACPTNPSLSNPQPRHRKRQTSAPQRRRTAVPARSKPTDLIDLP